MEAYLKQGSQELSFSDQDSEGKHPLHLCVNNLIHRKVLARQNDFKPLKLQSAWEIHDNDGMLPLHYLSNYFGRSKVNIENKVFTQSLLVLFDSTGPLKWSAQTKNVESRWYIGNQTWLHWACEHDHLWFLEAYLKQGAQELRFIDQDSEGKTPLHLLCQNIESLEKIIKQYDKFKLLDFNAAWKTYDNEGKLPLHYLGDTLSEKNEHLQNFILNLFKTNTLDWNYKTITHGMAAYYFHYTCDDNQVWFMKVCFDNLIQA